MVMLLKGPDPGVSQIGSAMGEHATETGKVLRKSVERMHGVSPVNASQKLGNQVSAETVCGPGGSRTVMRSAGKCQSRRAGASQYKGSWPDTNR